jgi:hypothetical protein
MKSQIIFQFSLGDTVEVDDIGKGRVFSLAYDGAHKYLVNFEKGSKWIREKYLAEVKDERKSE